MNSDVLSLETTFAAGRTIIQGSSAKPIYRPQGMDAWVLNLTIEGIGEERTEDSPFLVHEGDLLCWEPEAFHWYGNENGERNWIHLWIYFFPSEEQKKLLAWPKIKKGIFHLSLIDGYIYAKIKGLFTEIYDMNSTHQPRRNEICMSMLTTLLWWCDSSNPRSKQNAIEPRIQRVQDYITSNLAIDHSVETLAQFANLSVSRFAHLFKSETGKSPFQFLEQQRIFRACKLLLLYDAAIGEIGRELGYEDQAYFTRVFKRHIGIPPREYRKRKSS